jgi:hypothetical protein
VADSDPSVVTLHPKAKDATGAMRARRFRKAQGASGRDVTRYASRYADGAQWSYSTTWKAQQYQR